MHNTLKVGELLIHAGVIDELQLKAALAEQQQWGRRIGVTLIKMGMVEENHLIRALAQQLGLPATSLVGRRIAPEVIALVPSRIAIEHAVIPLFVKRTGNTGKLFLGMEDPSKLEVLDDLCFRTGLEIQPVMMGPTELAKAIERYYTRKEALGLDLDDSMSGETTIGERSLGLADSTPVIKPSAEPRSVDRANPAVVSPHRVLGVDSMSSTSPMAHDKEISIDELGRALPDGLVADVGRIAHETEKTRLVVKAITQLLVDKQILSLDEIQSRIGQLRSGD
jgi:type IV pilus assembly protein PilB